MAELPTVRELQKNLITLRFLGWTWKRIGLACGKSITWAFQVAHGRYEAFPSEEILKEILARVRKTIEELPPEAWKR